MARKAATRKTKTAKKTKTRARRLRVERPDAIDALIASSAEALALPIDPAWHGGVRFNLRLIFTHAALVDEFPLADDIEPAPVFHA